MSKQKDKKKFEKMAEEKFPHPTESWKREIWVKKLVLDSQMSVDMLMEIHVVLEDMASLTAQQGSDSTEEDKKQFKKDYRTLANKIKEISPEYYKSIKIQDE